MNRREALKHRTSEFSLKNEKCGKLTHELVRLLLGTCVHGGLRWFVPGTAAARGTLTGQHRHRVRERAVVVGTVGAHS